MYKDDIKSLFKSSDRLIKNLYEQSEKGEVDKVDLKHALDNMRTILDYSAGYILDVLKNITNKGPNKVYFPYNLEETEFVKNMQKNFPQLATELPDIYNLLESIQPFKINDEWLYDLCKFNNDAKHNNLTKTEHEKSSTIRHALGTFLGKNNIVSNNFIIYASDKTNNRINVSQPKFPHTDVRAKTQPIIQRRVGIHRLDDVHTDSNGAATVVKHSGGTEITIDNKFKFKGRELEIVPFLKKCNEELKNLTKEIDKII